MGKTGVIALIVTYNPDLDVLGRLVDSCLAQVDAVLLVDNGDGARLSAWLAQRQGDRPELLALGENKGIATAQNAGIGWARSRGARQVLLFDHDSNPPADFVARLQSAFADLQGRGERIAAIGPRYVDSRWNDAETPSPFVRFASAHLRRCYPASGSPYVAVDFLIASGCLIDMRALDDVGGMRDELFIDYVDIEWGARARRAGWAIYGVWDIVMQHNLGDDHSAVFGRAFAIHSPTRHYYMLRNAVRLCLIPGLLRQWKLVIALSAAKKFIAYSLFMPHPFAHFRLMCRGIWDAVRGRMGKISEGQ